jgi:hypothetical protein
VRPSQAVFTVFEKMKNLFDWLMIFLVLVPLVSILLSIVIWSLRNGISPMPTVAKVKRKLFTVLPDQIPGTIYEFGSGWGSLLIDLGRHYPNHPVLGYEMVNMRIFNKKNSLKVWRLHAGILPSVVSR